MARVYGRLVDAFGFSEVREASIVEVQAHLDYWAWLSVPGASVDSDAMPDFSSMPREMTPEQYEHLVASMKANAAQHGVRRG